MASMFPNGSVLSIGTAYAPAVAISDISNAKPAIATAAGHALEAGDIVLLSSGWTTLDNAVVRIAAPETNSFSLEGVDTANARIYTPDNGGGAARKVTEWVALSQTTDVSQSGGEPQKTTWRYLEDPTGSELGRRYGVSARAFSLTLDYDPKLAWHAALHAASLENEPRALRVALPNGADLYYGVTVTFDGIPSITINENMRVTVSLDFANPNVIRYEAD